MSKPEKTMFDKFIDDMSKAPTWGQYPKIMGNLLRDINAYSETHDVMLPSFLLFLIVFMVISGYIIFFFNPYKILDYAQIPMIFIYFILFSYILFFTVKKFMDGKPYYNISFEVNTYTSNYFKVLLLIPSIFIAFYILYNLVTALFVASTNMSTTFTIILLTLVLAIVNSYTNMYTSPLQSPILEYIKNLIFYIPCLISDFIDYIKEDYKNTPTTVFILFVIIIFVLLIYAGSYFYKFKDNTSNIVIVDKPIYLNTYVAPLSKKDLNEKIIDSKPFYEKFLYNLQEKDTVKYDLSFNTTDLTLSSSIPAYVDKYTRQFYIKESFTSVMTDETFPVHLTIDDYDKYILQQAMWTNPAINDIIKNKDSSDGDVGKYINSIIENQKTLMSYYEKTMLYLATLNNSNFSKNFVKDLSNNNYNYSLSFWVYLNPNSKMKGKNIILKYGNRPSIYFNNDTKELTMEIINQPDNKEVILYRSSNILYQRWNHVVINNNNGSVDLFINSNLVGNYKNTISYSIQSNELLQVGSKDNNDIGGIAYVYYYEAPLTLKEISDKYINKPSF
jgi:hypothetical protein